MWVNGLLSPTKATLLPPDTFRSTIETRTIKEGDREITYYVVNSANRSDEDFYSCKFDIISKGELITYHGFLSPYTETDCKPIKSIRPHYDCLLNNWMHRTFEFPATRTLPKFSKATNYEIPVSRFYEKQTRPKTAFLSRYTVNDIYKLDINCKTEQGKLASHTQTFAATDEQP